MPEPPTGAQELERLATRLHFGALHLVRRLRRADETLGLSPGQLSVLSTLVNRGPMSVTELADAEQVRPPTMTRVVQALEAGGYVLRRAGADDGRRSVLRYTTKGWMALERAARHRARTLADALAGLEPAEVETLKTAVALIERISSPSP